MPDIMLIRPTGAYAKQISSYREEFLQAESSMDGTNFLRDYEDASEWLRYLERAGNPAACDKDKVPSSTYIAVRKQDDHLLGMIDLRHHVDHPVLSTWGGHIGYSVRPSERGKGYGTEMLRQALPLCRELGIRRLLMTCNEKNPASERIILANGGVYEKLIECDGQTYKRFWIDV